MLITHEREKLLNTIVYFVSRTEHCGLTKLFKLINFLDFDHYSETGRSVTGQEYFAWDFGPVPTELFFEIKQNPKDDLLKYVSIQSQPKDADDSNHPTSIRPLKAFESRYFSKRELGLLERLAFIYKDATADEMSHISHANELPWRKTIKSKGEKGHIDYKMVLDAKKLPRPREIIEDLNSEYEETKALLR